MIRTLLVFLAFVSMGATADAAPIPVPAGGYTVERNAEAVRSEAAGTAVDGWAYAYADVSHNRVVTAGPLNRRELAHEVCHILDFQALSDGDRAYAARIMRSPARGWFDLKRPSGDGAEWFADYCSAVAINLDPRPHRAGHGLRSGDSSPYARITYRRLREFHWFLFAVGVREGLTFSRFQNIDR